MTISEKQLETWARYIQLNKNTETYDKVKSIFAKHNSNNFDIYLQGSVANKTNIWADGDLDIVLQFNGAFNHNAETELTSVDYESFRNRYSNSAYTQQHLRSEIKSILDAEFIPYTEKNKCIKLNLKGDNLQDVDLVPCFQYRNYQHFDYFVNGIIINTLDNQLIINYPKQHMQNGVEKNEKTFNNYKKTVRIFKNLKKGLVEEQLIVKGLAPSYFIECLIYNIPDAKFNESSFTAILINCLDWLSEHKLDFLLCQNKVTYLFGQESTMWSINDCQNFIESLFDYLEE